jgi:hypothetical protein
MSNDEKHTSGWIGVDLDRTLAHYDHWRGVTHIGEPIPLMLQRVKDWLAGGSDVRIFTARVSDYGTHQSQFEAQEARSAIEAWCEKHLGKKLPVTNVKDYHMYQLWDDRAVQVFPNTGIDMSENFMRDSR